MSIRRSDRRSAGRISSPTAGALIALLAMGWLTSCASDPVDESSSESVTTDSRPVDDAPEPSPITSPQSTPPNLPGAEAPIRFAVIGDFGTDCCGEGDVADLVDRWGPEFVVTTGDNRYDEVKPDEAIGRYYSQYIGNYDGEYGPGADVNRFFPSAGNHDYSAEGGFDLYLDYFDLPGDGIASSGTSGNERYYDFVQDPIHFFVVNSNDEEPDGITSDSDQAAWLQTQLAASEMPWQIVITHHPPYSSGYHGPTDDLQWPYVEWGADVVMSGHEHSYERIAKGDTPYIVNGSGGRRLRGLGEEEDPDSELFFDEELGALFVEGCATQLAFEFRSIDDEVIDELTLGEPSC